MRPSPGLVLAVLLVLVAAQVTRLVAPERAPWLACLGLAVAGLVAGELVAATGHLGGPSVGSTHPVVAGAFMAAFEAAGAFVLPPAGPGRR